jgi:DNA-binding transcriptional regulator YdaS (Cro superfamily)
LELRDEGAGEVPTVVPSSSGDVSRHSLPPDLAVVVGAWEYLPNVIKVGILALVQAAGDSNQNSASSR